MQNPLIARASTLVKAPIDKVWQALTDPKIIKQYFFGADVVTDWKEGGPILYRGEWQGKAFEDKGIVIAVTPGRLLVVTHWSPLSGIPDVPENYHTVTYELSELTAETRVTITQDNNVTEDERNHSQQNWETVLQGMKRLLEG